PGRLRGGSRGAGRAGGLVDIYRITRSGGYHPKPQVRYGTKRRANAIARQVRENNESLARLKERYPGSITRQPVQVTIELAPVSSWIDVTGEWFPAGEGQ